MPSAVPGPLLPARLERILPKLYLSSLRKASCVKGLWRVNVSLTCSQPLCRGEELFEIHRRGEAGWRAPASPADCLTENAG